MDSILTVSHLSQTLKIQGQAPKEVLKDVHFHLPQGSLTGFIGVNGAGKTTTLKSLLEFIIPREGKISFFGEDGLTSSARQKIGFLPERPYFYEYLTGREFLGLHWKLRGHLLDKAFEIRLQEVLESVDLVRGRDLKLRQYSKGMLQRIGIAQAIFHKPQLLILDEPMSGLDPDGRQLVKNIIKGLHQQGITIFFSSHLLQDMEELCDRLIIIDNGRIIYEGTLSALWSKHSDQYSIEFSHPKTGKPTLWTGKRSEVQKEIDRLRSENTEIHRVEERQISLEEAFILLRKTGGGHE